MNEYIRSYASELNSKFQRLSNLIKHGPSIGTYHENVLRNFLTGFLSKRCGVKTGFVFNAETGEASKQVDVLIIDENDPAPYYFVEGDFAVVKSESVIAAIEIKSILNKTSFIQAIENATSFRKVSSKGEFYVFSYQMKGSLESLLPKWYKDVTELDELNNYPSSIYVLNKGFLTLLLEPRVLPWGHYFFTPKDPKADLAGFVTAHFLSSVIHTAEFRAKKESKVFRELMTDGRFLLQAYRFKSGVMAAKTSQPTFE